ncbi:MAG: hypothetical protein UT34_C0002G0227 [candidate division WS6 bacterium GW2011_GWF2_39_15]|uniref:Uncharacterized protein n=1 Tax=candidate division WS6 bacterium GW2011_GWF2_39_15 TaxID=1619100 RepID=A0A0G0Q5N3_9BACT|nr:MAG: hypothetical protein UT34_C0002G0227 [candidate division WS6 bacterium GW2011_GWF2_39_15]
MRKVIKQIVTIVLINYLLILIGIFIVEYVLNR